MHKIGTLACAVLGLAFIATTTVVPALEPCGTPTDFIFANGFGIGPSIAASNQTALATPDNVLIVPDEHSSFLPPATPDAPYTFFVAARVVGESNGAVVLQAGADLQTFTLAPGYASPVLSAPKGFNQCAADGDPPGLDSEFDENYAAPGSVLQDPTLPAGNLIMVYEGENHCRQDPMTSMIYNVQPYYATVGFARSSDNGVTWPAPVLSAGTLRYPIVGGPDHKPDYDPDSIPAVGDAIPSAYIRGSCLYVVNAYHPAPDNPSTHAIAIQIARAQLDGTTNSLTFQKYFVTDGVGGFTSDSLTGTGTNVIPFTPIGVPSATPACTGTQYQPGLSFNDALHRFVMTMVCEVSSMPNQLAWFYSTATSLDAEDWTPPQIVANTQSLSTTPCPDDSTGASFDGWYPSLYSTTLASGHTGKTNIAFYLSGCNLDTSRVFTSRTVTVTPDPG